MKIVGIFDLSGEFGPGLGAGQGCSLYPLPAVLPPLTHGPACCSAPAGMTMHNYDVQALKAVFQLLQDHYPER